MYIYTNTNYEKNNVILKNNKGIFNIILKNGRILINVF